MDKRLRMSAVFTRKNLFLFHICPDDRHCKAVRNVDQSEKCQTKLAQESSIISYSNQWISNYMLYRNGEI